MYDPADESLGKRIRNAKIAKVPYFVVLGDQEVAGKNLMVESRDDGNVGTLDTTAFVERIRSERVY